MNVASKKIYTKKMDTNKKINKILLNEQCVTRRATLTLDQMKLKN